MNLWAAFVPNTKATELVQPREGPFHHPSGDPEATAMFGSPFREHGRDLPATKFSAMGFGVIPTVALERVWFLPGPPRLVPDRRDGVHQGKELGYIVGIGPGEEGRQGNALGLRDDVVLAAQFPSIRRIRARFFPPPTARTDALSTTARDQSIWSASRSLARRSSWSFCHTPARCQARRYRQQLMPDPHPISGGSISQGMPLLRTKRMPVRTLRRSRGVRPGCRNRRRFGLGSMGSMSFHKASETSSLAMCMSPFSN